MYWLRETGSSEDLVWASGQIGESQTSCYWGLGRGSPGADEDGSSPVPGPPEPEVQHRERKDHLGQYVFF